MKLFPFFFLIAISIVTNAQVNHNNYYEPPLRIPLLLNGSFAELRTDHFHSGVDFKTQGTIGLPVYAVANGIISRIKISPTGFGNAIYIDHPNGTTSVYGHLSKFIPEVEKYIQDIQYKNESFDVDVTVSSDIFPVKKGQQIAWSGNSGSSAGPHLHFEIRNTKTEKAHNPLLYHFPVKDQIKPSILSVLVYPVSQNAAVYGKHKPKRFETVFYNGSYHVKRNPVIPVFGKIGFGLQATDYMNNSWSKCGISSLQLTIDNQLVFSFKLDSFSFDETRYINSFLDYEQAVRYNRKLYKTWIEPGNHLNVYDHISERGLLDATDGEKHQVNYLITDTYGNQSSLKFTVVSKEFKASCSENGIAYGYEKANSIIEDSIEFILPEGTLYSDIVFNFDKKEAIPETFSKVYQLHNNYTPLHKKCSLKIKPDSLPKNLREKALLALIDPVSEKLTAAGGRFEMGWVSGEIKILGNYTIVVDTIAPEIVPLSISNKTTLTEKNRIRFTIKDDFAGIAIYRGTIDGKWVLFEYDPRTDKLSYSFDSERLVMNKSHILELSVTDHVGNKSFYQASFLK